MAEKSKSQPLPLTALRSFEALARCLDPAAAGAELNVTSSAIMHQIRQLEEQLGRRLILRDRTTVTLTPSGRILFSSTNKALTILRQALIDVRMPDQTNALNVLIVKDVNHPFIRERINGFITANSTVSVNVTTDPTIDAELIESYSAVFTSTIFDSDLFDFRHIHREELLPCCRPDYLRTLAQAADTAAPVRLLTIENEGAERDRILAALKSVGIGAFNFISFPTRHDAARAAMDGIGIAMIDRNLYQEEIIEETLTPAGILDAPQIRDCYLAVRKSHNADPILRSFSALFRNLLD